MEQYLPATPDQKSIDLLIQSDNLNIPRTHEQSISQIIDEQQVSNLTKRIKPLSIKKLAKQIGLYLADPISDQKTAIEKKRTRDNLIEQRLQHAIYINNFGVDGQHGSLGRILSESTNAATNSTGPDGKPTKTSAQIFMTNLIYGITAFLALVAFVLLCVAVYLLC